MAAAESRRGAQKGRDERLPLEKGAVVADRYVIEDVIGSGGVGVVVSARDTKAGGRVAIKFLQTAAMASAENVSRFDREARAAARIKSEHVARVMDFGILPSGAQFMVLEHLEGKDLGAVLKERHHLPLEEAVDYVAQACEAVAEAHALGIVHRDLKPANLFLTRRADGSPIIKVLDFGISKLLARSGTSAEMSMTQTASVMGSPLYMSPEQMVTPRDTNELTDVWSLGTILYEFLSGRSPFESATMPALCARICTGSPTPLRQQLPPGEVVPEALEAAIMRCLERDRGLRHNSVADLARRIAMYGTRDAAHCADRAARVSQQAGIPLGFDDDEEKTQVAQPLRSRPPPGMVPSVPPPGSPPAGATDETATMEPSSSESRPVSFIPRPNRILGLRTQARLLVGVGAVLFVGTLVGAAITASRTPAPEQIVGHAARTVARESQLVSASLLRAAPSAPGAPVAPAPVAPVVTADPAPVASTSSAPAADSAKPAKTKHASAPPPPPPPAAPTRHLQKTGTDSVLSQR